MPTSMIKTAKLNNNIDSKRTLILFYYNRLIIVLERISNNYSVDIPHTVSLQVSQIY